MPDFAISINHTRPAVDVLFSTAAEYAGRQTVSVLLTGMGADGAEGMSLIKKAGGRTIAQNEETCIVYGMPKAAVALNATTEILALDKIGARLTSIVLGKART